MKLHWDSKALRASAIFAAIGGFAVVAGANSNDSEKISFYMHEARLHATQAAADLELLQTYAMASVPWQVHFKRLQQVDDDVNAMIKDYNKLNALRYRASGDQAEALDRIQPLLQDLQVQVKETLRYLNYNSAAVNMPPFTQRVHLQYSAVNQIFSALCNCAKKNNVLVATARDRTAPSDCSKRGF